MGLVEGVRHVGSTAVGLFVAVIAMGIGYLWGKETVELDGRPLCPAGGPRWKNFLSKLLMKLGERKKLKNRTPDERLETFMDFYEPHPKFNDSLYFNFRDMNSNDVVVARMSRKGPEGKTSYVFLCINTRAHGLLTLEEDDVELLDESRTSVLGLTYDQLGNGSVRVRYDGPMEQGYKIAGEPNKKEVHVKFDVTFEPNTPWYTYFLDDDLRSLGKLFAQEEWTSEFWESTRARSKGKREHVERFGKAAGFIEAGGERTDWSDLRAFRDHSWDIRDWKTIERHIILWAWFEKPLVINGVAYHSFNLLLIRLPKNAAGLQHFMTGWLGSEEKKLTIAHATRLEDTEGEKSGVPPAEQEFVAITSTKDGDPECVLRIKCFGEIRRVMYWPDLGDFEVYDDAIEFEINGQRAHGIREYAFTGDYRERMMAKYDISAEDMAVLAKDAGPNPYRT